jgi:FMN phosphatase YigB (HAD superfamily)
MELLLASGRLFGDVLPFMAGLRARGIKVAIVSNCDEQGRGLLDWLGVTPLADALVLSCEVGAAKPSARIFQRALQALGVSAGAALFVDDNPGSAQQRRRWASARRRSSGASPARRSGRTACRWSGPWPMSRRCCRLDPAAKTGEVQGPARLSRRALSFSE